MFTVEIRDAEVIERNGEFEDGKKWSTRHQMGWMHVPGEPYPQKIKIKLARDAEAYRPGNYEMAPDCIRVFRDLPEFSRYLNLRPVAARSKVA